ncbi:ribosome maturation factor RimP [Gordonia crocea]|uniref:Ribosome maturation factor RimP n=1 Tax=Gordonia crocea TaxID=589162 RepID=A0A7I9UWX0_9ACTN|nr:ribosome maturation factor RimP [Gordonia crocea]GED97658.1 ribosome maturation factor RimP [Gordonia crocea]
MPDHKSVAALVEPVVVGAGFDVDDVAVADIAGGGSAITVVVDGEDGVGLDALTDLTRALTASFDTQPWAQDYTLDVMSRGVDSPLTLERHWRRNLGRKAELTLAAQGGDASGDTDANEEKLTGRIGTLVGDTVSIVVNHKGRLAVREVALSDVVSAVVTVEFGEPSPAELKLCRGEG